MRYVSFAAAAFAAMMMSGAAYAADHQVQMLNKGAQGVMVFEPNFVQAAPGDTVTFVPTDKGHDAASIDGMLPEGAQSFKGQISKPITITLDKEGVYGVKCVPHFGMGMVALIVAGKPVNLEQAKAAKLPGKAKTVMAGLLAKAAGN
ncbi:MAG: pseudoazurin [Mesorhizobium sp.]|nr:pseudoazurin [Mesorhizobium sp.]MBN9244051.1 pseudoazurin [Mesorhizobium sp.]